MYTNVIALLPALLYTFSHATPSALINFMRSVPRPLVKIFHPPKHSHNTPKTPQNTPKIPRGTGHVADFQVRYEKIYLSRGALPLNGRGVGHYVHDGLWLVLAGPELRGLRNPRLIGQHCMTARV